MPETGQVACLEVPYFAAAVARRADHTLGERPLVLLDGEGRVLATDGPAARTGILAGWGERQVQARCPEACCVPASRYPLWEAQEAFCEQARSFTDRWQPVNPGSVYLAPPPMLVDERLLHWCQAVAGAVRTLGWEPALGVTGSKFGAGVAGQVAGMNAALLVAPHIQRAFLAGQPVDALPLDEDILRQLHHLGIRTLGQYAHLPSSGVLARFGQAGRTAQRWAQGLDDRPVVPPWEAPELAARIEFDGPFADRERILAALARQAERLLPALQDQLQAAGRLTLQVARADGRVVQGSYHFPLPTAAPAAVRLGLAAALDRVPWDGQAAAEITLTLGGLTDVPGRQLTLFDLNLDTRARLETTLRQLAARYGPAAFRLASLTDPENPLPERRTTWRGVL